MRSAAVTTVGRLCVFAMAALNSAGVFGAPPATRPTITVDTTDAPELADFAVTVWRVADEWCPRIAAALPSEGYTPPPVITITFRRDYQGVAECSADRIKASVDYFTKHPKDLGAFVHELVHVVQHYDKGNEPSWITEGIADYVRFYLYEPPSARPHPIATTARYNDSYRTTAAFLDWVQRTYDPKLVERMNVACRQARYDDDLWRQFTGKPLAELGDEWRAQLTAGPATRP